MSDRGEAARRIRVALQSAVSDDYLGSFLPNFRYAVKLNRSVPRMPSNEQRNYTEHLSAPLKFLLDHTDAPAAEVADQDLSDFLSSIERGRRHICLGAYYCIHFVIGSRSKTIAEDIERIEAREERELKRERRTIQKLFDQYNDAPEPSIERVDDIEQVIEQIRITKQICAKLNEIAQSLDELFLFLQDRYY